MNTIILVGNIENIEKKHTSNGTAMLLLNISGQTVRADGTGKWFQNATLMGAKAEKFAGGQGDRVLVIGSLESNEWNDKETGEKRSILRTRATDVTIVAHNTPFRNEVTLYGGATRDPELRYTPSGSPVVSGSIGVSESWKDKDGNWKDKSHYVRFQAWEQLAEQMTEAGITKGTRILLSGSMKSGSYEKDGKKRSTNELVVSSYAVAAAASPQPYPAVETSNIPTADLPF
jgi:single-strand DNA-binding protein